MSGPSTAEIEAIKRNLFAGAHTVIEDWIRFPWHTSSSGAITTPKVESSQTLAIDVFGTIAVSPDRNKILNQVASRVGLPSADDWHLQLEWQDDESLLSEPRPTQVDACAISSEAVMMFECKFTEVGGTCSQPRPLRKGAHKGLRQCNGNYERQTNPVNGRTAKCALSAKGIRYWDEIPSVFTFDDNGDYRPCPFAGTTYQWMRNLVTCAALAEHQQVKGAVLAVYADGPDFPMANEVRYEEWDDLMAQVNHDHIPLKAISYQELIGLACEVSSEAAKWASLAEWVDRKITEVARLKA